MNIMWEKLKHLSGCWIKSQWFPDRDNAARYFVAALSFWENFQLKHQQKLKTSQLKPQYIEKFFNNVEQKVGLRAT